MDNLNELQKALLIGPKAVDDYLANVGTGEFILDMSVMGKGETFTKLEMASLMIAQGMLSNSVDCNQGVEPWWHGGFDKISKESVLLAKAVLQEANK